jgi:hypothetical protein
MDATLPLPSECGQTVNIARCMEIDTYEAVFVRQNSSESISEDLVVYRPVRNSSLQKVEAIERMLQEELDFLRVPSWDELYIQNSGVHSTKI